MYDKLPFSSYAKFLTIKKPTTKIKNRKSSFYGNLKKMKSDHFMLVLRSIQLNQSIDHPTSNQFLVLMFNLIESTSCQWFEFSFSFVNRMFRIGNIEFYHQSISLSVNSHFIFIYDIYTLCCDDGWCCDLFVKWMYSKYKRASKWTAQLRVTS